MFVRPGSGWKNMAQTAQLGIAEGAGFGIDFGNYVAVSGKTVVVGSNTLYQASVSNDKVGGSTFTTTDKPTGGLYVYAEPASGWANMTETARLTPSDGGLSSSEVSISGDTIIAGASEANVGGNQNQGAVYVFSKPATGWTDMT